jgi:hypothetical protein
MAITLTSTGITFPVGIQEKAAHRFALGFGNYWRDMTSERQLVTTYTNAYGRPIMVFIKMAESNSNACVFEVDGVVISSTAYNLYGNGSSSVHCIVPKDSTYRINNASWPLGVWLELRT